MKWIAWKLCKKFDLDEIWTARFFYFAWLGVFAYLAGEFMEFVYGTAHADISMSTTIGLIFFFALIASIVGYFKALFAAQRGWFE